MPQLPTELLNTIGVVLEIIVAVMTALLVAFWIGLVVWTFRDIRSRTRDIFAWLLATILVLVLGPIGWLLYFLLRPRETMAQVYDRQLEEEALLRDITVRRACPKCQTVTESDWLLCPQCGAELRRKCVECGRPLELSWIACPYCTASVEKVKGSRPRRPAVATPVVQPAAPSAGIVPTDAETASAEAADVQTIPQPETSQPVVSQPETVAWMPEPEAEPAPSPSSDT